jgi:hypothetical protein
MPIAALAADLGQLVWRASVEYATMALLSAGLADRIAGARFRAGLSLAWSSALIVALAALPLSETAHAHGIAGNRYFPGTLTFDDPAVADEAIVPNFSSWDHPAAGGNATDNRINWSFTRLLTPTVEIFRRQQLDGPELGCVPSRRLRRSDARGQMGGLSK